MCYMQVTQHGLILIVCLYFQNSHKDHQPIQSNVHLSVLYYYKKYPKLDNLQREETYLTHNSGDLRAQC
jgi:hypothetical protein